MSVFDKVQPLVLSEDGELFDLSFNTDEVSFEILALTEQEITELLSVIGDQVALISEAHHVIPDSTRRLEPLRGRIKYPLKPSKKKPTRRSMRLRGGWNWAYNRILVNFLGGEERLADVTMMGKSGDYLQIIFKRMLRERGLEDKVKTCVVNDILYLEKVK